MSTLRRLALAGAFALPISLVAVAPSSAGTLDGPYEPWTPWSHFETSGSYAGIGGAATTDTEGGSGWWGHHWSESDGAYAGIGGAAVTHSEESGIDDDTDWNDGDDDNGWTGHGDAPVTHHVQHHAVSHPDPVEPAEHATFTRPAADTDDDDADDDAGYVQEAHWAGADGASSAHIASHAGDHYATYDSGHLTAGPDGASSEGVHALAVPGYAGYHNWYTAAGTGGTAVHSVTAEADADTHDHDWQDHDEDYDSYDS